MTLQKSLSTKQQSILRFIRDFLREKDYPPSIRDIQEGCNISSTSVVDYNLKALERMGFLKRDREVSRAIELLDRGSRRTRTLLVPVVGQIAAGQPIPVPSAETFSPNEFEEDVEVTSEMTHGKENVFALRVKGESMIEDGIFDGDYIFVRKAPNASPGDIVVALIEDEATVKRYYPEGERIRFQPANSKMEPIYVSRSEFRSTMILGNVVGVYRKM